MRYSVAAANIRHWRGIYRQSRNPERVMVHAVVRLQAHAGTWKQRAEQAQQRIAELEAQPVITWIPVAERLPDTELRVLAAYNDGRMTTTIRALHIPRFAVQCDYNPDMELDYNPDTDLTYYPGGWYEACEEGEYSFIGPLTGTVTHWAKLPALPEPALEPPPSAADAMAELRDKFGHYFDAIEDVDEWVRQQRSGEDDPPPTQQEAQP